MKSLILVLLITTLGIVSSNTPSVKAGVYVSHIPIWILGNSGFTVDNGVVSGTGTRSDPFIIEDWDITVGYSVFFIQGASAGILVENTTASFIIRSVYVHDGPDSSANIVLKNVTNGSVDSVSVSNGNIGVLLWMTRDSSVARSEVSGFHFRGIGLDISSENAVEGNTIHDLGYPILARASSHNRFINNTIQRAIGGVTISRNSSYNTFQDNIIRDSNFGIDVSIDSNFNLVSENTMSVDREGILVGLGSTGNIIRDNNIPNSGLGVLLNRAVDTQVTSNNIVAYTTTSPPGAELFTGKGVWVLGSNSTRVTTNVITAPVGISICNSLKTFIAPPHNDLSGSSQKILQGPKACP